ncbi:MAG: glycosyltransferase family 4 protein [Rhodospirillaceae bacterium]
MKLLYLITEDWFFCSHFIDHARSAKAAGYDVVIAARESEHGGRIREAGLRLLPLKIERRSTNPLRELRTLLQVCRIYASERPHIVHHIALKPIIYGSLAARITGIARVVNAPVGLGYAFTSAGVNTWLLRRVILGAMRWLMNPPGSRVVFENRDDLEHFVDRGLVHRGDAALVPGSGVELSRFRVAAEPPGTPTVVLTARMLWDKGVGEFVQAARLLRAQGVAARFVLIGAPDAGNPASIPPEQLMRWRDEGIVDWLGYRTDIPELLAASHIVCLPSYREGLPKALVEALAAGRPIVTTDVPGCRELVKNGENGILVPPRDAAALARALAELIANPGRRARYGAAGRRRAEQEFHSGIVIDATLRLYESLLNSGNARRRKRMVVRPGLGRR